MRRQIFFLFAFLAFIVVVVRFSLQPISEYLGLKERAGLEVESSQVSKVFINDKEVGKTPYKNEQLSDGEIDLKVMPQESSSEASLIWEKPVKLNAGTLTVVNREIASDQKYSSGEVITLEKGQGVTIVANPSGATISIDGEIKGQTPLTLSNLPPGEKQFLVSKDGYLKRSIRATLVDGYMLTLTVDLALAEIQIPKATASPSATPTPQTQVEQVVVTNTPNGFLRVRNQASTTGSEIERVKEGDVLDVEEVSGDWYKVKLSDGKEGYVSADYVKKKE